MKIKKAKHNKVEKEVEIHFKDGHSEFRLEIQGELDEFPCYIPTQDSKGNILNPDVICKCGTRSSTTHLGFDKKKKTIKNFHCVRCGFKTDLELT